MGCSCLGCGAPLKAEQLWWCDDCVQKEPEDMQQLNNFNSGAY